MNTSVPIKPYKYRVTDAWGEFIALYPWEWFVTLTFTDNIHPEAAEKSMHLWLSMLSRHIFGPRWYKKQPYGVYWLAAFEYQKRGVLHIHMLIAGVKDTRRLDWKDKWEVIGNKNGFARVEPIESRQATSRYVTKYVAKDGEIILSRNLPDPAIGFELDWFDSNLNESNFE